MLMMVSMVAKADVKVLFGEKGTELEPGKDGTITLAQKELTGGTIIISQEEQKDGTTKVTFAVTPDKNYKLAENGLEVYAVIPTDISPTRGIEVSGKLTLKSTDYKDDTSKRTYTTIIDSKLALWVKSADFQNKEDGSKGNRTIVPFDPTTDDDITKHTEKLYWMESVGATGFYAVPHSDNTYASTTNAPTLRALWYFMESGESGYYYIINKTGKYLKKEGIAGNDNTIQVADYDANNDVKFKFSFGTPEGVAEGNWVIYPKDNSGNDKKTGWLSKKSGNLEYNKWLKSSIYNNTPVGDLNSQWKIVARNAVQWPRSGLPFDVSTSSEKHYYRINHAQSTGYNISYDGSNYVTISTEYDNKTAWYFEEAATDFNIDNLKYYYIVNASSNKYLKFTATTINGNNQSSVFTLSDYNVEDADRFQFVVVNSYGGNAGYSIMPKLAMSKYDAGNNYANSMVPTSVGNNKRFDLKSDRNNNNAHWNFVTTEYPMKCKISSITYDSSTGKITITRSPSNAAIHYTLDGTTEPTSSVGTQYSAPFVVSGPITIKGIATKDGYVDSEVTTKSFDQVATPSIQDNGSNAVSITSETEGATIYYTTDGSNPNTGSTVYSSPLTDNVSGVEIKAIAVKDGMINSAVGSGTITLSCANPVFTRSGNSLTISCPFPTSGVSIYYTKNGGDPTSTSTPYSSPISVETGDVIKAIAIASGYNSSVATKTIYEELTPTDGKYLITSQTDFEIFVDMASTTEGAAYHYILRTNVDAGSPITKPFTGVFEVDADENSNFYKISGLTHPLFNTVDGGTVKNVTLKGVAFSNISDDYVGAIAGIAKGYSRIYNCGILPNDAKFPDGTHPTVSTSGACAGGIVGKIEDDSRVINCYSYADVSATTTASGIVGYNAYVSGTTDGIDYGSTTKVENVDGVDKYTELRTAVVNCMFYGDITGGSQIYPVYGGAKMLNTGANGINNYNFYRAKASINVGTRFNCSWPASEENLTRFEYYRYLLNSNREICGWWVNSDVAPNTLTTGEVQAIEKDASLMAKWVLDPSKAPYPILKPAGYYPSVINQVYQPIESAKNLSVPKRVDPDTKQWVNRASSSNTIQTNAAPDTDGQTLGTITVTIKKNSTDTGVEKNYTITAMDLENNDFCYGKIQLPYYNNVFGNPNGTTWSTKFGGNYTDKVVTGWDITTEDGTAGTFSDDPITGNIFADRNSTAKDTHRVFAQGGYYYVPYGVGTITITAHWATAYYLGNGADGYYDRVWFSNSQTGSAFAPAGTRSFSSGAFGGQSINNGTIQSVLTSATAASTVYDCAIVLVGNHQYKNLTDAVDNAKKPFTIMSVDLDFDNEPDYCLEWQVGSGSKRAMVAPVRFDFLPVVELGVAMKEDDSKNLFALGKLTPYGHFEVTETSVIHFGQFEYENSGRTIEAPVILNNGVFDQICRGTDGTDNQHISYFLLGGHVKMPSFTPGAHVTKENSNKSRHCAVNVLGGEFTKFYLTGNYNNGVTPNDDDPHCYIDGGKLDMVASAAKEGITGSVYWKIDHAYIGEFYGGGISSDKRVTGSIEINIDRSKVTKFCGGPMFGDMYDGQTVTTTATGTTFGVYYGAGNGGTCYSQYSRTETTNSFSLSSYTATKYEQNINGVTGMNGYHAKYEFELVNTSAGTDASLYYRTYLFAAQFATTNTGDVSNTLTDCTIETNFFGGGNLGGVTGSVTSELKGHTVVEGNAYGAGYSAKDLSVDVLPQTGYTAPKRDTYTAVISDPVYPDPTPYVWTNEPTIGSTSLSTSSPTASSGNINYLFTEVPLVNLGAVSQNVSLTIGGTSEVHQNVFGGGEESGVDGNTIVTLKGEANISGNVFGGGNKGTVSGSATVNIE